MQRVISRGLKSLHLQRLVLQTQYYSMVNTNTSSKQTNHIFIALVGGGGGVILLLKKLQTHGTVGGKGCGQISRSVPVPA